MKLKCIECGEIVQSENINIQDKIAVCQNCDTLFQFALPNQTKDKTKRRKVHQPSRLAIHDEDHLHMSFHTNWRLEQNETFLTSLVFAILFSILTVIMLAEREFGIVHIAFSLVALTGYYGAALAAFNKTHIQADDTQLNVSRQPLPGISTHDVDITLANVESFSTEETATSQKEGYDLPRFNVYANRFDGGRMIIVKDVTEEYGRYIAQTLNTELVSDNDTDIDVSHLTTDSNDNQLDQFQLIEVEADNQQQNKM